MDEGGASRFHDVRRRVEVDSTNQVVADLARGGGAEGIVVVADHQTAGRGRWGRRWEAPPGSSLLVSVLLRPAVERSLPQTIAMAAGVAAAEACAGVTGVQPGLKWPNDLLVGDDKMGGILCELVSGPAGVDPAVVVGLGLNVNWVGRLPPGATSLNHLGAGEIDRETLLTAFLARLDAWVGALADPSGRRRLLERYRELSCTLGRAVTVFSRNERLVGRATAIGPDGHLVVEGADGRHHEISAGDVTHLAQDPGPLLSGR